MAVLPLLQDGSCSLQHSCLTDPQSVHAQCPQAFKCGTCVAWSPREKNRFTRNAGQCLLDRSSTQYLDCNAPICPYYRPRADNPAAESWARPGPGGRREQVRARTRKMTREAPPPTGAALADAAFRDHDVAVAKVGTAALAGVLARLEPLPSLLERFRGGTARVSSPSIAAREVPLEALWARIIVVRRSLARLEEAVAGAAGLDASTRDKAEKDLAGIAGSMTTFNLLFAKKEDGFKGSGKGE
jgi:hypothetical protein